MKYEYILFVSKNILMKVDNYSYDVKIGWGKSDSNLTFYCPEKEVNKFVKRISSIMNAKSSSQREKLK